jgi:hypothetical protein
MSIFFFMAGCVFNGFVLGALANRLELRGFAGLLFICTGAVVLTGLLSKVFL